MKTSMFRDQTGKVSFNKVISFLSFFLILVPATFFILNTVVETIQNDKIIDANSAMIMVLIYLIIVLLVVAPAAIKAFIEKSQFLKLFKEKQNKG